MISSNKACYRFAILAIAGAVFFVPGAGTAEEEELDLPGISKPGYGRPTIIATPPPVEATVSFSGDFVSLQRVGDENKKPVVEKTVKDLSEEEYLATRWSLRALPPRPGGYGVPLRKLVLMPKSSVASAPYLQEMSSEFEFAEQGGDELVAGVEDLGVGLPEEMRGTLGWFLGRPTTPEMLERISVTVRNALHDPARPIDDVEIVRENGQRGALQVVVTWRERLAEAKVETNPVPLPGELARQASAH